jgi:protein-arginine kinase activator protein McsA
MIRKKVIETKIKALEKEKALKVKEAYYERAAQIRDMIRYLKREIEDVKNKKRL